MAGDQSRATARALLKQASAGASGPQAEGKAADATKLLEQAADDYAGEGLNEASGRCKRAVDALHDKDIPRALAILAEPGER